MSERLCPLINVVRPWVFNIPSVQGTSADTRVKMGVALLATLLRSRVRLGIRAALFAVGCSIPAVIFPQGLNNLWMGGYQDWAGPPVGTMDLQFSSGALQIGPTDREINFFRTSANITNSAGDLLFSTNGAYVANAAGDTMLNGSGLSPGAYTAQFPDGLFLPQGVLILPKPDTPDKYYLFHCTIDDQPTLAGHYLYLTTVDMSLNGGDGAVVSKNQVIVEDVFNYGRLTAVRHANGRDWWVFCHKIDTDIFYRLLVTPAGITIDGTQAIGAVRPADAGQVCFSPDGGKFAYYWGEQGQDLDIFDFDRCTGLFSNPVYVAIDDYNGGGGVAFSPNSRYVYVSSVFDAYQYDTEASDIGASMVHIAEWDSFYSPQAPFATLFDIAQLAPDGKVYIATGNSTFHLHVINQPDEGGLACDMVQHGIELPYYFWNSLPNHPNYHLGPVDGSVCDSLGINTGLPEDKPPPKVQAYPNPSNGRFTLSYAPQPEAGELEVRDQAGRMVLREYLPPWSQMHQVVLQNAAAGMYQCRLRWGTYRVAARVVVER